MPLQGSGIVIFNTKRTHILLILDSRSEKWSIPKGHWETYDASLLDTAIREVQEETHFLWGYDYMIDCTAGVFLNYMIYEGYAPSMQLRAQSSEKEHVSKIAWIDLQTILTLPINHVTKLWYYAYSRTQTS